MEWMATLSVNGTNSADAGGLRNRRHCQGTLRAQKRFPSDRSGTLGTAVGAGGRHAPSALSDKRTTVSNEKYRWWMLEVMARNDEHSAGCWWPLRYRGFLG